MKQQFKTVYNNSRGGLESLKRLKNILSQSSLNNVYRALVESNMRYADVIWGSLSNSKIESLQRLQGRAISMIHGARIKDNSSPNFLTFKRLITFDRAVMVYKILNQLCPENLWNKFHLRSDYNLEYAKKGFSYSALKIWNEIPLNIREIPTLDHFTKNLKIYLMS